MAAPAALTEEHPVIDPQHIINYLKENGPKTLAEDLSYDDDELFREALEDMVSDGKLSKAGKYIYRLAGDSTSHKAPRPVRAAATPPPTGLATTEQAGAAPLVDKQLAELKAVIAHLNSGNSKLKAELATLQQQHDQLTAELVSTRSALKSASQPHAQAEPDPAALPSLSECIYRLMYALDADLQLQISEGSAVLALDDLRLDLGGMPAEIEAIYNSLTALLPHRLAA